MRRIHTYFVLILSLLGIATAGYAANADAFRHAPAQMQIEQVAPQMPGSASSTLLFAQDKAGCVTTPGCLHDFEHSCAPCIPLQVQVLSPAPAQKSQRWRDLARPAYAPPPLSDRTPPKV